MIYQIYIHTYRLTNINEQGLFLYRVSGAHPVDTKQGPGPLDDYEYTPEEGEYDPDDPLGNRSQILINFFLSWIYFKNV